MVAIATLQRARLLAPSGHRPMPTTVRPPPKRGLIRALALSPLLAFAAAGAGATQVAATPSTRPGKGKTGLYDWPFELKTLAGETIRLDRWRGKPAIVAMDHTGSAIICSDTSRRLRAVQAAAERLGKRFDFIVLSLDPAKDSPEGWKSYLKTVGLPDADWHFLHPSPADAELIALRLGVKHWVQDGYLLHDVMISRVDARGRVVRTLEGFDRNTERFLR
jgi:cytochrome oxidase Cu insertion factor (SCO1/SenC/PrrC family)